MLRQGCVGKPCASGSSMLLASHIHFGAQARHPSRMLHCLGQANTFLLTQPPQS